MQSIGYPQWDKDLYKVQKSRNQIRIYIHQMHKRKFKLSWKYYQSSWFQMIVFKFMMQMYDIIVKHEVSWRGHHHLPIMHFDLEKIALYLHWPISQKVNLLLVLHSYHKPYKPGLLLFCWTLEQIATSWINYSIDSCFFLLSDDYFSSLTLFSLNILSLFIKLSLLSS